MFALTPLATILLRSLISPLLHPLVRSRALRALRALPASRVLLLLSPAPVTISTDAEALVNALQTPGLAPTSISLYGNRIGDAGWKTLAPALSFRSEEEARRMLVPDLVQ